MSDLGFTMADSGHDHPEPPRRRGVLPVVVAIVLILGLLVGAGLLALDRLRGPSFADYDGEGTGEVLVEVVSGDTLTAIGRTLEKEGVVADARRFAQVARDEPRATGITPGFYLLAQRMSASAALTRLLDPQARVVNRLVIPEGTRASRVAALIADILEVPLDDVVAALADTASLPLPDWAPGVEGLLFPATYEIAPKATIASVLETLLRRFGTAATRVDLEARAAALGRTPWEIVTIASIIEAEVAPADFAKASRVIYNRLERGMRLQMDSTVNYALGGSTLMFTPEQLRTDNPYNTYVIAGLPPGPIGSPGQKALEAALAPEDGDWLFFVSVDPDAGITKFATTEREFFRYREEFQRWYRENR